MKVKLLDILVLSQESGDIKNYNKKKGSRGEVGGGGGKRGRKSLSVESM